MMLVRPGRHKIEKVGLLSNCRVSSWSIHPSVFGFNYLIGMS